ncbi:unnamed protein product [Ceratitis capitata]|uniref:(Mediterranean fruit fly) hypothetical protein n=1 Tax=Ceratitis capitata TaxID=7213 RepID=A0A811U1I1_CERCA|nr:unnamed protein product [Ceratitis capitata]
MLARTPTIDTRPAASTAPAVDLIAGNEFLKLFLEREETQRGLHSGEHLENAHRVVQGVAAQSDSRSNSSSRELDKGLTGVDKSSVNSETTTTARSLNYKSRRSVQNEATTVKSTAAEGKQLVKLVTSGSKIVFFEEYDDNDAIVDAVAREIDIKKEISNHH